MSYEAIICRLKNVRPHSNGDFIQLASALGVQVIVGLDKKENDIGILFPDDGCLSPSMCTENNLYNKPELNKNKEKCGFFSKDGRVKAQNFRGEKSYGFWTELSSLEWTGIDINSIEEGFTFTTLNGQEVCKKYINPATLRRAQKNKSKDRQLSTKIRKRFEQLKEHFDTKQLRYEISRIPEGSILYFSEKIHGCVDKNTIVETLEYGSIKIQKVVEEELMVHIKSMNLETQEIEYVPIEDFYFYPNDNDWYEIELEDGSLLEITGNNPVWLAKERAYRRVDQLKSGDTLLVSS